ncbi:MAG: type II toxin-antitoxin system RelE/ParE family toxin [Deltaproteobacteria bacterium]|nr:MAG: type II toxin-antitoxin system RelE/ParE family toxin [Deltaproteobacteria bacterium]
MRVRFLTLAQQELDNAVAWYNDQIEPEIRRCLIARFPYGLIYGIDGDTIVVVAVAHLHRRPRYWIDRI